MSSTSQLDARRFLRALKELLKERRITYADLAKDLQCSLPTVKRALNNPSLPLSRLLEIGEIAQISIVELTQRAERWQPRHFVFTEEQDRLFSEREEMLAYFLELAADDKTPRDIVNRHDLDEASTTVYLDHLTRIGLIARQKGKQVKLLVQGPFGFARHSTYMRKKHEIFLKAIVSEVLTADDGKTQAATILKRLILTNRDYGLMVAEIKRVIDRFAAISERRADSEEASTWQIAFACGPSPKPSQKRLPQIDS